MMSRAMLAAQPDPAAIAAKAERRELLRAKIAKREELKTLIDSASKERFETERGFALLQQKFNEKRQELGVAQASYEHQLSACDGHERELISGSSLADRIAKIEAEIHETAYPKGVSIILNLRRRHDEFEEKFYYSNDGHDRGEAEKAKANADKIERQLSELRSQLAELTAQAIAE